MNPTVCSLTTHEPAENFFPGELADPALRPDGFWIPRYAYDEELGKLTFFVQKAELHPLLKHLRSKNLEAWSCFSNVVSGEIIVEATPETSREALADFHFDRKVQDQAYVSI